MTSNFEKMQARSKANYDEMRRRQAEDELKRQIQAAQFKEQRDNIERQRQWAKEQQEASLRSMQEFRDRNSANNRNKHWSDLYGSGSHRPADNEIAKAVFLATAGLAAAKVAGANLTWKQVFAPVFIWLAMIFGIIVIVTVLLGLTVLVNKMSAPATHERRGQGHQTISWNMPLKSADVSGAYEFAHKVT